MKTTILNTLLALLVALPAFAGGMYDGEQDPLSEAEKWMKASEFEKASDFALQALAEADRTDDERLKAEALITLSSIDLMTWRDAQAWDNACEAEALARKHENDTLTADALAIKGRVCIYSNVGGANARDDESLIYFNEALELSRRSGSIRREVANLYNISQSWINKNRFNDPPDPEMYAKAGEAIDRAEALAREHGLTDLLAQSFKYRIRYYRQGGRTDEAIAVCEKALSLCPEDDYLTRLQIYDQLTILHLELGHVQEASAAHNNYNNTTHLYMHQKSDFLLQEMEARYDAAQKEYEIERLKGISNGLIFFAVMLGVLLLTVILYNRRIRKQKKAIEDANHGKEQLLSLVSREFTSPSFSGEISKTTQRFSTMDETQIREYCATLFDGKEDALGKEVADYLIKLQGEKRHAAQDAGLTGRELEIIRCCREGLSNEGIADRLFISVSTVKNHKQNIFTKMNVHSVSEMLSAAEKMGIA